MFYFVLFWPTKKSVNGTQIVSVIKFRCPMLGALSYPSATLKRKQSTYKPTHSDVYKVSQERACSKQNEAKAFREGLGSGLRNTSFVILGWLFWDLFLH